MTRPAERDGAGETPREYVEEAIMRLASIDGQLGGPVTPFRNFVNAPVVPTLGAADQAPSRDYDGVIDGNTGLSPPRHPAAKLHPNLTPLWTAAIAAVEPHKMAVVQTAMRDVQAGMPYLDEIGILLRPHFADNKIDPLVWEFGLPGRAGTEWAGALIKGTLTFKEDYPGQHPRLKTVPPLFHPNCYASGAIRPCFRGGSRSLEWPEDGSDIRVERTYMKWKSGTTPFEIAFPTLPSELRLPLLLHGVRLRIHFANYEDPAQLDAYTCWKKEPDIYRSRVRNEVTSRVPTPQDMFDLEDAQKRVRERRRPLPGAP